MPKMRIFLEKSCKIVVASGGPLPNPHWLPAADFCVVTLTYFDAKLYSFCWWGHKNICCPECRVP